ncbi:hypothetical protein JTB14_006370 [Gonioctena quinquepunctata]|nr:hypothetical protein JTB14_006370 [Gonioctena quinquepunctata]
MDFQQFNDVTNCSGKILDLVFSDDLSVGVEHAQLCLLSNHSSDPYHPAVEFKLDYKDVILSSHYGKEKSCFSKLVDVTNIPTLDTSQYTSVLTSHTFSNEEIENKLINLDKNKSAGPDGIPPLLLKQCSRVLST